MKIFQVGLLGLSQASLSNLDDIVSVVNVLGNSNLRSAHQESIARRFKTLQKRLTKSFETCGEDSGSNFSAEVNSDAATTISNRLESLQDWSDANLSSCQGNQFKFDAAFKTKMQSLVDTIFVRSSNLKSCDPMASENDLDKNKQWEGERGYWIGEYSFFGADGNARFAQDYWNYPYDHYTGFIVGAVEGNSYAQRNVFLYPPQTAANCLKNSVTQESNGECGVNGNHKEFFADQSANKCNYLNPGAIEGVFAMSKYTWTTLLGQKQDSVFYEVYDGVDGSGPLSQKQMTTIREVTKEDGTVELHRTRSAQGFNPDGSVTVSNIFVISTLSYLSTKFKTVGRFLCILLSRTSRYSRRILHGYACEVRRVQYP